MKKDEALKLALEALTYCEALNKDVEQQKMQAIAAIKEALAQPAQEPVAWAVYYKGGGSKSLHWPNQHSPDGDATMFDAVPLVPQRPWGKPWVSLTDEEIQTIHDTYYRRMGPNEFARAVESKLKEKNA